MTRFLGTIVAALAITAGSLSGPALGAPTVTVGAPVDIAAREAAGPTIATPVVGNTVAPIEPSPAPRPVTAVVGAPSGPITAVVTAPRSPTNGTTLMFGVTFSAAVTGLDARDFTLGGTAPGCTIDDPIDSAVFYAVPVTGCAQGTVDLTLGANSIVGAGGDTGPAFDASSPGVEIDRTPPAVSRVFLSADSVPAGTEVTLTATAEDDVGVVSAQGRVAGGSWATLAAIDGARDWPTEGLTGTFSAPGTAGAYAICVRATDVPGNTSDGAACVTLTVATTNPPPAPLLTPN